MNKSKTNKVLSETKNKEANYKNLLAKRIAKQKAFEEEIKEFEDQIRLEIDPSALPKGRLGSVEVVAWQYKNHSIFRQHGFRHG